MLQRRGRLTYGTLKRQFQLDEDALNDLKAELLYAHPEVCDDAGCGLVWTPAAPVVAAEATGRFDAVLAAVTALLRCEGRVTYRLLRLACGVDEALLAAVCRELTFKQVAHDAHGEGLVWTGEPYAALPHALLSARQPALPDAAGLPVAESPAWSTQVPAPVVGLDPQDDGRVPAPVRPAPEAERRQLTVLFCDLVGSTQLSGQLDPEDLRTVVRAYQEAAAEIIERYEGHIAQYLGDGLLVYFGYPVAHEDDAKRAVHAGLGIVQAIATLNTRLATQYSVQLAVRLGIHTGPVVVGVMGGGGRHEHLALGETPNIAARLQGLAPANTVVISAVTARLVQGTFHLEDLGTHTLHGVTEPMVVSRVCGLLATPSRDEEFFPATVPVLVGREEESGLLRRRWDQSTAGLGQVVFISGEAGIGKSALVEGLRAQVRAAGLPRIAFRCSPYHTTSALYPMITHLEHLLQFEQDDPPATKLAKLEAGLRPYPLPLDEGVPLLAGLLSVPLPAERYAPLTLTPQQQKQQTLDTLVAWLAAEAERQPVLVAWEDLHWADPTTLEVLGLVIEQAPTVPMLHVLTARPAFNPPWPPRSHMTPLVLTRLERPQVEALITQRAGGKTLPAEVVQYIVAKTDGVPLYVEELTKMLLTSALLREEADQYVLTGPLHTVAIPDTLQDALMARLDQLKRAKEVAQLGAVLGREFAYELLAAIAPQDEETLQAGLAQLVRAALLYQRGRPPRTRYVFKHALIQDVAYASLLKSTRQQVHQQIAQVFEARFPALVETQPELVAQHYTAAGCAEQAVVYWQRAGQHASDRVAPVEAISHVTTGIEVLRDPARDAGAYPAGLDPAHRPRRSAADGERAGRARGGAGLHPGPRPVSAGGRDPRACTRPVWSPPVLCRTVPVAHGARAGRHVAAPGAPHRRPHAGGPRPLYPWHDVDVAWRLIGCPHAPGGRHRPLHARPASCAGIPHGPRSGGGLPRQCRDDPLVAGVPRASPGPSPRCSDVGARAVGSLHAGLCAVCGGLGLAVLPQRAGCARAGRGRGRARDRAGISPGGSHGHELAGVGAGQTGAGRGGDGRDPPGDRRLPRHWGSPARLLLLHLAGGRL
jgi:class 3 adenylate cyclase